MTAADPRLARIVAFFDSLRREDLARIGEVYDAQARFEDPLHAVCGLVAIEAIYGRMFERLLEPRFVVAQALCEGDHALLTWVFHFRLPSAPARPRTIRGASELRFTPDGRIAEHRDHWDAAQALYEPVPLLGALMRWLRRRAAG